MIFINSLKRKKGVNGISKNKRGKILVYVEKKLPLEQLEQRDRIPKRIGLFHRKRTKVIEIGKVRALVSDVRNLPDSNTYSPIRGGIQIRPQGKNWVGTLGIIFNKLSFVSPRGEIIDSKNLSQKLISKFRLKPIIQTYGITNAHVASEDIFSRSVGQRISHGRKVIGEVAYSVPISKRFKNYLDFALIHIYDGIDYLPFHIETIGDIKGYSDIAIGERVIKRGRTSRLTESYCYDKGVQINIEYETSQGTRRLWLKDLDMYRHMSLGGDSGSAIIRKDDKSLCGLLFAGSSTFTFGIPVKRFLERIQ